LFLDESQDADPFMEALNSATSGTNRILNRNQLKPNSSTNNASNNHNHNNNNNKLNIDHKKSKQMNDSDSQNIINNKNNNVRPPLSHLFLFINLKIQVKISKLARSNNIVEKISLKNTFNKKSVIICFLINLNELNKLKWLLVKWTVLFLNFILFFLSLSLSLFIISESEWNDPFSVLLVTL
jgi:hypothetical protein